MEEEFDPRIELCLDIGSDGVLGLLNRRYEGVKLCGLDVARMKWKGEDVFAKVLGILKEANGGCVATVPLFERQKARKKTWTARQIAWLLANAFVGNIKQFQRDGQRYGACDFETLFRSTAAPAVERLLCLFDYFAHCEEHFDDAGEGVTFERCVFTGWPWVDDLVCSADHVHVHTDVMEAPETKHGAAFVDFANKNLQIHRMIPSLTQEEVLFSVASACIVSLCCVDTLEDNETFAFHNVWRHSTYRGYLDSFEWTGSMSSYTNVIAIDALTGNHFARSVRDLQKAYLGFASVSNAIISTGKWGCGVFFGDTSHKFIQQLMAAQLCGKTLYYSSYGKEDEAHEYRLLLQLISAKQPTFSWLLGVMESFKYSGQKFHSVIVRQLEALPSKK